MSQKEVFDIVYSIVLQRGIERSENAINSMFNSFIKNDDGNDSQLTEDIGAIKIELIEALNKANYYKNNFNNRGITVSDQMFFEKQRISKQSLVKDLSSVENKDSIFYDKRIVITGVFYRYPLRDTLASVLKKFGADINSAISKKTEIVCIGQGAGPLKIEKIKSLKDEGIEILIINEQELYAILDNLLTN